MAGLHGRDEDGERQDAVNLLATHETHGPSWRRLHYRERRGRPRQALDDNVPQDEGRAMAPLVRSIELAGRARLQFVEQGDRQGLPLVLLHGVTDSWRSFERVL